MSDLDPVSIVGIIVGYSVMAGTVGGFVVVDIIPTHTVRGRVLVVLAGLLWPLAIVVGILWIHWELARWVIKGRW